MNAPAAALEPSIAKGKFAALIGVSPGRVSQYIAKGKIRGQALDGEGRAAKIRPYTAAKQLKVSLDITQRIANGLDTRLDLQAPGQPVTPPPVPSAPAQPDAGGEPGQAPSHTQATGTGAQPASPPVPPAPTALVNDLDEQIKRERLDQVRRLNRKAAEEEAARAGSLTDTEAAARQMGRLAAQLVTVFEGALSDFANALASKFEVPSRDALHVLRLEMRKVRTSAATTLKRNAETLPATVEYEIEGADEEGEEALAGD